MYQMPAEWEKHRATLMIWPNRKGSWGRDLERARETFAPVYRAVTEAEYLYLTCKPGQKDDIEDFLRIHTIPLDRVHIFEVVSDDNWARDITPSILVNRDRKAGDENRLLARDFIFNAWGGEYNGLYQDYEQDNAFGPKMMEALGIPCEISSSLVLEGGSIHVDGEGTCMVTETCLLSPGRNPDLSREEIEGALKESLGCTKILWLPRGIYNDETDEHVDNVCCFIKPGHVLLNWCDDPADPQYELTQETYHYLSMCYVLPYETTTGALKTTASASFTFHPTSGNDITLSDGLQAIPVQRNYRTNIVGKILSGDVTFNVKVDPMYDGEYNLSRSLP